jgi:hypothetical protein
MLKKPFAFRGLKHRAQIFRNIPEFRNVARLPPAHRRMEKIGIVAR